MMRRMISGSIFFLMIPALLLQAGSSTGAVEDELKDLTPQEAYKLISENGNAVLIDVRSQAEYTFVGHPPMAHNIPWMLWNAEKYSFEPNPRFGEDIVAKFDKDLPILFLCRSGGRSTSAGKKALSLGFKVVYNVVQGFEGSKDNAGHRTVNGWKNAGVPYTFDVEERLKYK